MGRDNLDNAKHPGFGQSASPSEKREFSNDWKTFFGGFPMIGKNFRDVFGKQKGQKGQQNKRRTKKSDNSDNFRQLFSALKSMETASRTRNALGERMFETTWTTRDNFFKVRRPTGRREENGWKSGWFVDGLDVFQGLGKFFARFPAIGKRFWGTHIPLTCGGGTGRAEASSERVNAWENGAKCLVLLADGPSCRC